MTKANEAFFIISWCGWRGANSAICIALSSRHCRIYPLVTCAM